jgi:glycosyltransferase involved in cell wall biosynthesis
MNRIDTTTEPCIAGLGEKGEKSKRVLLIAYHYPPCQQSSGHLRTLGFSRYLPEFGWGPMVLTANTRAYSIIDWDQCERIPSSILVERAFALDASKHLSIRRRYPSWLAMPDRWSSWWLGAVPAALALVRRYRPQLIWATQPIPTAFLIALSLHRLTGIPWIADFRDPISEADHDGMLALRTRRWIERKTAHGCACAVFTAPGAARRYAERYPDVPPKRWSVIRNGYDETGFHHRDEVKSPAQGQPLRLVHSGLLYRSERDPRPMFAAIADLLASERISARDLRITLRGSGSEDYYRRLICEMGIGGIVRLEPVIPHEQALRELHAADGLLVFQGRQYNDHIPTKVYEYLQSGKPILALTDQAGDTAELLREAGIGTIVQMDSKNEIRDGLLDFIESIRTGKAPVASDAVVERYSRRARTRELAALFDEAIGEYGVCRSD